MSRYFDSPQHEADDYYKYLEYLEQKREDEKYQEEHEQDEVEEEYTDEDYRDYLEYMEQQLENEETEKAQEQEQEQAQDEDETKTISLQEALVIFNTMMKDINNAETRIKLWSFLQSQGWQLLVHDVAFRENLSVILDKFCQLSNRRPGSISPEENIEIIQLMYSIGILERFN